MIQAAKLLRDTTCKANVGDGIFNASLFRQSWNLNESWEKDPSAALSASCCARFVRWMTTWNVRSQTPDQQQPVVTSALASRCEVAAWRYARLRGWRCFCDERILLPSSHCPPADCDHAAADSCQRCCLGCLSCTRHPVGNRRHNCRNRHYRRDSEGTRRSNTRRNCSWNCNCGCTEGHGCVRWRRCRHYHCWESLALHGGSRDARTSTPTCQGAAAHSQALIEMSLFLRWLKI